MNLVNLTGHDLRLGNTAVLLRSRGHARVKGEMKEVGEVVIEGLGGDTFPVLEVTEREIRGLPDPVDDTLYIVSGIVSSAARRKDVVSPSRTERTANGRVTACHAFVRPVVM